MSFVTLRRPDHPRPPRRSCLVAILVGLLLGTAARAEDVPPERIKAGASIFARNCSPCHGSRMQNPTAAFDLRTFPRDEHERFVSSVTHGKNQMPSWGDMLSGDDIEALWAYVTAGEKTPDGGSNRTGATNLQFDGIDLFEPERFKLR